MLFDMKVNVLVILERLHPYNTVYCISGTSKSDTIYIGFDKYSWK